MELGRGLDARDQRTLRLTPLWLFSAIVGSHRKLDSLELAVFWHCVDEAIEGATGLGREVLLAVQADADVVDEYEQDGRPVVSGLLDAMAISSRLPAGAAGSLATALLTEFGERVARARGPFGRSVSRQDAETLQLLTEILDVDSPHPFRLFAPA